MPFGFLLIAQREPLLSIEMDHQAYDLHLLLAAKSELSFVY